MKTPELKWYAVDLDGTLADTRPPHFELASAPPIEKNLEKLGEVAAAGFKVMIHTSRHWDDYAEIEEWLTRHEVPYKAIWCGKPLVARYVDDKAINAADESWI